ncbi:MAG: peptidylprolyl isomerase [Paludibacteraceae bacterium]|nr:peptidylprolyl isomerase [Paludibacteraceae bacterium]
MQKRIKLFILFVLTLVSGSALAQDNVIDEVVWVVGDESILKSDVEKQIQQMKYEKTDITGDPYCIVPEQLAIRKLFLHQAKTDSLTANEGNVTMQVNQRVNDMISQIGSQEKLEEYFGKTIKQINEELQAQAREQMLIQQVQQKLVGTIKLTPSEVRKAYSKMKDDEIPLIADKVEVQILTIAPAYDPKQIEEIKTKLRDFKQRVESGDASFSMLATLYSDDVTSAKVGGELGFMGKAQLVPEFAAEAFSLTDPKKVSHVIQTEFGFHIIQLIERRGDKVNCRHILLKPKVQTSEKLKATNRLDSICNLIRVGKVTFENAVLLFSDDKDTRMSGGLMNNSQDGTSKFEYQGLPSEISKKAYNLTVGTVSEPFTMTNESGREVCVIIKIKSKTEQHKANIEEDYQQLKASVQNKKSSEILNEWIKNKQKETYVYIDPNWQKCTFQYPNWIKK